MRSNPSEDLSILFATLIFSSEGSLDTGLWVITTRRPYPKTLHEWLDLRLGEVGNEYKEIFTTLVNLLSLSCCHTLIDPVRMSSWPIKKDRIPAYLLGTHIEKGKGELPLPICL